ncbi:DNA-3-methyladenine glycosylase 2 family protein [Bacillus sp. BRMEA1]|uniref:DNA-3-methyladenine glycosylase family protein n=1 Tax=Neobacillus endophyticus TaxID=2738405 RepID=UPI00156413B5|nr:DNA-3-methyladenine glycosylase [Neobacillus endophyticus]NRD78133.1 DNA-3-methyladenine glycosylase 2 family protein [Neobacillus endophyticus]
MWQETIHFDGTYNFDSVLARHATDPLKQLVLESRSIRVPVIIGTSSHAVEVTAIGTVDKPEFIIKGKNEVDKQAIIQRTAEIFQWNVSLRKIQNHFQQTDLKEIFQQFAGTPLILDFDLFGCLVKCIIHQQINMTFAYTLTDRFVKTYGYEMDGVWFYPQPETVAKMTVEQLRDLQFSSRKAEYVIDIAKEIVENGLDLGALKNKADEEIFQRLTKIRGVGKWTVENFLLFGLGRPNLFPVADIGIQNGVKKLYNLVSKPTNEEMERYKQAWEPYLSYASMYLWRSLE